MPLDLASSLVPQRQHFHTDIHHTSFVPASSNSVCCRGVTTRQAGICCPPFPYPSRKQRRDREARFFCTNYLMCDLGAWLHVMCSLCFILSFNLSSNLFATVELVSQQWTRRQGNSIRRWHEAAFINGPSQMLYCTLKGGAFELYLIPQNNVLCLITKLFKKVIFHILEGVIVAIERAGGFPVVSLCGV